MKSLYISLVFMLLAVQTFGQPNQPDPEYKIVHSDTYVGSKNYYLLNLFNQISPLKGLLERDQDFIKINENKRKSIQTALKSCKNISCLAGTLKFSDEKIRQIGSRLQTLYRTDNELGNLVRQHIIPSGYYGLYAASEPVQVLIKAWEQDAKALNHTISVYAEGKAPNYPKTDSLDANTNSKTYFGLVEASASLSLAQNIDNKLFFAPSLIFALQSLEMDQRNQIADYEPMEKTVNKAAYDFSKKVNWDKYKYTVIVVPGAGPDKDGIALSCGGMVRCRLAAIQYHKGLAPFIMVSGGAVHPYKTKFNEAWEMKKYLIETLNIPEHAILMEPHARHTTTNLRNAARLIFRYGFPMEKAAITSTIKSQSFAITETLLQRCEKELGYRPFKNGKRLSETEAEFYPLAISMQLDFDEPMDP